MVRRLSSSEVEITATETNATTIKGGITEFDIMGMNPGDFPDLPSPGADHTPVSYTHLFSSYFFPPFSRIVHPNPDVYKRQALARGPIL